MLIDQRKQINAFKDLSLWISTVQAHFDLLL